MTTYVTLKEVETFLAVCRKGSFLKAGKALGRTQANVSKIIAGMEKKLDMQLFVRVRSGAELTLGGRAVIPYAQEIMAVADKIRAVREEQSETNSEE